MKYYKFEKGSLVTGRIVLTNLEDALVVRTILDQYRPEHLEYVMDIHQDVKEEAGYRYVIAVVASSKDKYLKEMVGRIDQELTCIKDYMNTFWLKGAND